MKKVTRTSLLSQFVNRHVKKKKKMKESIKVDDDKYKFKYL